MEELFAAKELLVSCQKEFPSLDWGIMYCCKGFSGVEAKVFRFHVSVYSWHKIKTVACITHTKIIKYEFFRSNNKNGATLDQALSELRVVLEGFATAFGEAAKI